MDPEQLQFLLEGFEAAAVLDEPGQDASIKETRAKKPSKRIFFPDDLPEEVLKFDLPESERTCPQTGAERRFIRWEESTKINFVPGALQVARHPPRGACGALRCKGVQRRAGGNTRSHRQASRRIPRHPQSDRHSGAARLPGGRQILLVTSLLPTPADLPAALRKSG
jgi:hypothetical protein